MRELSTAEMAMMRGGALNVAAALSVGSVALAMHIHISVISNGGLLGPAGGTILAT
jgi:hypothetical protein